MLKFCCECVRREIRQNRTKKNQFLVSEPLKRELEKKFKILFKEKLKDEIKILQTKEKQ